MEIEGIVIRNTPFSDYDSMVCVLTKNGKFSFLAKGVRKFSSKTSSSTNLFNKGKFQIFKFNEGLRLRNAEIIDSYENLKNSLNKLSSLEFINEILNKFYYDNEFDNVYNLLENTLSLLNNINNIKLLSLVFLINILVITGYAPNTYSCSKCGKKNDLCAFSINDGGFICSSCFDRLKHTKLNNKSIKILDFIRKNTNFNIYNNEKFNEINYDNLLEIMVKFTEFNLDISLKSYLLIKCN